MQHEPKQHLHIRQYSEYSNKSLGHMILNGAGGARI